MKLGIFYDTFVNRGGAERTVSILANHFKADIITAGYDPNLFKDMIHTTVADIGNLTLKNINPSMGLLESDIRFYMNRNNFDYDLFIFCGMHSIFAAYDNTPNIWLCFTPSRLLYDLKEERLNTLNSIQRPIWNRYIKFFSPRDQNVIKNEIQKIIVNSKNTQMRVKSFYGLDSRIIYSPIETEKFKFKEFGDFFLTVNRIAFHKRVDLIAKAFTKMPDKNLVIIGDGPDNKKLLRIIKGHHNIRFLGSVDDVQLKDAYSRCLATIYVPMDEDFGRIPLEGMAAGKPCIAANEGGCKETVIHNKTGFLTEPTIGSIIKEVKRLSVEKAEEMKDDCIIWAKKFDTKTFIEKWKNEIKDSIG